ncbi:MAG TPA: alanine racemase [Haliangiales bacterium]|nr:alanine racemase [Haliangiales bacterium]
MKDSFRCWAEVDLDALRGNLAWIRHRVGPQVKIMTVVKADAYGHGLKQTAALLMQSGTDIFGVANLAEARAIHSVGQGWPVLMLGACLPGEVGSAVLDGVRPTISTPDEAKRFSRAAVKLNKLVHAHIKVDTGMGRLGVSPGQTRELLVGMRQLPGIEVEGLYTHYSSVEDDARFSRSQRKQFEKLLGELAREGIRVPLIHANNSGALLHEPDTLFNLVRPGLLVYGIVPPGRRRVGSILRNHLRPALSLKSRVSLVKEISRGTSLSYGRTFVAPRAMRVATLTAGYGDGYLRAASNRARVLVGGRRCAVLGRVTMDQMMVDVSRVTNVRPGDEAVLIGDQGREAISAGDLAAWCGTVAWEVLTSISYRVPRIYRGGQAA